MMKFTPPLAAFVMTTALSGQVNAQDLQISRSGSRPSTTASEQNFSGQARVETLRPTGRLAWPGHP